MLSRPALLNTHYAIFPIRDTEGPATCKSRVCERVRARFMSGHRGAIPADEKIGFRLIDRPSRTGTTSRALAA